MIERNQHGATTIQDWLEDLLEQARTGGELRTSAGAEPHRSYAYIEFHRPGEDRHSLLLFEVAEGSSGRPEVLARRIDGTGDEVSGVLHALVHR